MNTTQHKVQEIKPVFVNSSDLVKMGLYPSVQAVSMAVHYRKIPFYKHGKKLLFKPEEVIGQIESARRPTAEEEKRQAATHVLLQSVERY